MKQPIPTRIHIVSADDEDVAMCGARATAENSTDRIFTGDATCSECIELREEQRWDEAHP